MLSIHSPTTRAVAALSLTQLIGWGAAFFLPAVTGPAMAEELGLALPFVMAGPTIMLIVMAAISWPLSRHFERHGARPFMMAGAVLGAAGLLTLAAANGGLPYILAWVLLGFTGATMLTTPAQIALTEVAGEKARPALSLLVLAGGLTSTIIWPLAGLLQSLWGWRLTTLAFAALMLLVCLPLHWATLARHPRHKPAAETTAGPLAIDRRRFALLAFSFAANGFVTWGFALTIIILFEASGLDHTTALAIAAFIGIAQWGGRMVDILGGRHLSGFVTGIAGAALFPLSFLILLVTSNATGAIIFAALYGIASGITAVTRATLPLQIFPRGAYARASAQLAVPLNLSYAVAPPIFTAIMTSAGPYAALWLACATSILALSSLATLFLLQRRMA